MNTPPKSAGSSPLRLAVGLGLALSLAAPAHAESLLTTNGKFFAWPDTDVPGNPGVFFGGNVDFSTLAEDGTLAFRADLYGTNTSGINSRALFTGSSAATLAMLARWNDPAPGLPGLSLINSALTQGIHSAVSISPSGGYTIWSSPLSGPGVTTTNNTALFGSSPSGSFLIAREGSPAPGTAGAVYSAIFGNTSGSLQADYQFAKINRHGTVLFDSQLAGGDVVGTTNNLAYFTGTPGAVSLMRRQGDTVLPGPVTAAALGFGTQLDNDGRVLYNLTLAGAGVTAANNSSLWLYTPGSGHTLLAREGDPAPGTAGANFADSVDIAFPGVSPTSLTRSGRYEFTTSLVGGDAIPGFNDTALYAGMVGGAPTLIVRSGQPAPGTDAFFAGFSPYYSLINDTGDVAFQATLTGGTADDTNDTGVWTWRSGTLSKVVREGDPVAGMPGTFYDSFIGWNMIFNDLGQIIVHANLHGGEINYALNTHEVLAWDPAEGLFVAARNGEDVEGAPGNVRTTRVFSFVQFSNSDGVSQSLGKNGTLGLTVQLNDGGAVATVDLNCYPSTAYGIDGDGDGYGDVSTRVNVCSYDTPPAGYIPNASDCNDQDLSVHQVYYHDADGDGYGNAGETICAGATPPAGYVLKSTDCDDTISAIHPLAPDANCDGVDDNCNGLLDEEFVNHNSTCGVGACASSGFAQCDNGVFSDTCVAGTPTAETCNGIDDNCDGTIDNAPVPTGTPTVSASKPAVNTARLTWPSVPAATGYDVARGGLQTLRSSGGNFSAATTDCLGNDLAATTVDDSGVLAVGQGVWYVLRAESCGGNASYDSGSPKQVGSRDAEIAASGHGCP
jgi:hypothetical protein